MSAKIPSIVQRFGAASNATRVTPAAPSVASLDVPISATIAGGHGILVLINTVGTSISGVTDSAGNSYAACTTTTSANYGNAQLWYALNVTSVPAGGTVHVALSAVCDGMSAWVLDVADLAPSGSPVMAAAAANAAFGAGGTVTVSGVTVSQANVLLFALACWDSVGPPHTTPIGAAPDVEYQLSQVLGYTTPATGGVADSETYNWHVITSGPNPVTDFASYLIYGYRALGNASGTYGMTLDYVSGTTSLGAAARGLLLVSLEGRPNSAPNAPALTARSNFDATTAAAFAWAFSDPDTGDTQSAYQLQVIRASDSAVVYDSGKVTSAAQTRTLAGGTLSNGTAYQWKVRTWDQDDLAGSYSTLGSFSCATAPTATITFPATNGATVTTNAPAVTWTYSGTGAQSAYQLRLLKSGGLQWSSGSVAGAATSATLGVLLLDAQSDYSVEITVYDAGGEASAPVTRTFVTSFTPPPTPTLTATADSDNGRTTLVYSTPAPSGGQDTPVAVALLRRVSGTSTWTQLTRTATLAGTFRDYTAADDVTYDYKATAYGVLTGSADSSIASALLHWDDGVWLHAVSDPAGTAHWFLDRGSHGDTVKPVVALVRYAGRRYPVAQFDASADDDAVRSDLYLPWDLQGTQSSARAALEALVRRREPLCYRDHRSRVVFGVVSAGLQFDDVAMGYTTTLTLDPIDYEDGDITVQPHGPLGGTVAATTTPQRLTSDAPCTSVIVQLDPSATTNAIVGWATGQTHALEPGESVQLSGIANADLVYVRMTSGTGTVNWLVVADEG